MPSKSSGGTLCPAAFCSALVLASVFFISAGALLYNDTTSTRPKNLKIDGNESYVDWGAMSPPNSTHLGNASAADNFRFVCVNNSHVVARLESSKQHRHLCVFPAPSLSLQTDSNSSNVTYFFEGKQVESLACTPATCSVSPHLHVRLYLRRNRPNSNWRYLVNVTVFDNGQVEFKIPNGRIFFPVDFVAPNVPTAFPSRPCRRQKATAYSSSATPPLKLPFASKGSKLKTKTETATEPSTNVSSEATSGATSRRETKHGVKTTANPVPTLSTTSEGPGSNVTAEENEGIIDYSAYDVPVKRTKRSAGKASTLAGSSPSSKAGDFGRTKALVYFGTQAVVQCDNGCKPELDDNFNQCESDGYFELDVDSCDCSRLKHPRILIRKSGYGGRVVTRVESLSTAALWALGFIYLGGFIIIVSVVAGCLIQRQRFRSQPQVVIVSINDCHSKNADRPSSLPGGSHQPEISDLPETSDQPGNSKQHEVSTHPEPLNEPSNQPEPSSNQPEPENPPGPLNQPEPDHVPKPLNQPEPSHPAEDKDEVAPPKPDEDTAKSASFNVPLQEKPSDYSRSGTLSSDFVLAQDQISPAVPSSEAHGPVIKPPSSLQHQVQTERADTNRSALSQ